MTDKIKIIVEHDGEYHKFVFGDDDCKSCSLHPSQGTFLDACDICGALYGHFEKVVIDQ